MAAGYMGPMVWRGVRHDNPFCLAMQRRPCCFDAVRHCAYIGPTLQNTWAQPL